MKTRIETLTPKLSIHPGEMILDEIIAFGYSQTEFASKIGMKKSQLNEIIKGKRDINAELASLLEAALGISAQYWLNLQNQYDIDKVKINLKTSERIKAISEYQSISSYVAISYLKKLSIICGDPVADLPVIYNIYGVQNQEQLIAEHSNNQYARFRMSSKLNIDKTNLIGWIKYSEFTAKSVVVNKFNGVETWQNLKTELRNIILANHNVYKLTQKILSEYGIKLLYQPKAKLVPVDGIAFWSGENPTISLTIRHQRLDRFAFTLFHELGHVYLHIINDKEKEIIDIFSDDTEFVSSKEEIEANQFASDNLIPSDKWNVFKYQNHYEKDLIEFADEIGIHPSVVLGRLCFENNKYNVITSIKHQIN